eukprot:719791-Pyramimonas_sp.AAC.1
MQGPMTKELGENIDCNIVDESGVCTGYPPPPSHPHPPPTHSMLSLLLPCPRLDPRSCSSSY